MKKFGMFAAALLLSASVAIAAEVKSGLQPGDSVGAFTVEKVSGNPSDGVDVGKNLCYRCMLGGRPVVMVFARKTDASLAKLIKKIDAKLPEHKDQKLASFVNVIGSDDAKALKAQAKEFGDSAKPENVAIVVPEDSANGPADFKISPDADVTVILYRDGKVEASHGFASGKLDDAGVDAVIADTAKILK